MGVVGVVVGLGMRGGTMVFVMSLGRSLVMRGR